MLLRCLDLRMPPLGTSSGSRNTRVDPSRGELVDKDYATVEECLSNVLSGSELDEALANWRPKVASSRAAAESSTGWLTWI